MIAKAVAKDSDVPFIHEIHQRIEARTRHFEEQTPPFRLDREPRERDLQQRSSQHDAPRKNSLVGTHQPRQENHDEVTKRRDVLMHKKAI